MGAAEEAREFPLLSAGKGPAQAPPADLPVRSAWIAWRSRSRFRRQLEHRARKALREEPRTFGPAIEALFDLVSASDLLPIVAPAGRLPRDFAARCLRVALELERALAAEGEALEAGRNPRLEGGRDRRRGPASRGARRRPGISGRSMQRRRRFDPEAVQTAGRRDPLPRALVRRLVRLAAAYPGDPEEGVARGELAVPGTPLVVAGDGLVRSRPTIPGSAIVLAAPGAAKRGARGKPAPARGRKAPPPSGSARVRAGGPAPVSARRLGLALATLDAVWPEAATEVRARTRLVLPVDEPGLVSYSLPSRPGVSYVNLRGKSVWDLADDLLHETAHHRLHAIEAKRPLVRASGGAKARGLAGVPSAASNGGRGLRIEAGRGPVGGGEEVRYWSPWRRAMRPVRGILHACYTFAFRAELLRRIVGASRAAGGRAGPVRVSPSRARRLSAEARREERFLAGSLKDLKDAAARGLLTPAGRRLLNRLSEAARAPGAAGSPVRRRSQHEL